MIPVRFIALPRLPLNLNGKIDRERLTPDAVGSLEFEMNLAPRGRTGISNCRNLDEAVAARFRGSQ